ncbi:MAG: ribonuclease Z [Eubacteriales bacterium]
MNIALCLDEKNGMLFNCRRQSRDRVVTDDIVKLASGRPILMHPYSVPLFYGLVCALDAGESFLEKAGESDLCFVENALLLPHITRIRTVTVYRWNRKYPADFFLDADLAACGFELVSSEDFPGFSHEKITKECYRK